MLFTLNIHVKMEFYINLRFKISSYILKKEPCVFRAIIAEEILKVCI